MKNRKRLWIIIIGSIVIASGIAGIVIRTRSRSNPGQSTQFQDMNLTLTHTVTREEFGDYFELIGTVQGKEYEIGAKVSGEVLDVRIDEGDRVEKGEVLVRLDDLDYQIQYLDKSSQYESSVNEAPKIQEKLRLELEVAKRNLENTSITAPVSGVIQEVYIQPGERAGQSASVCKLVHDDNLVVKAAIDEVDLSKISEGRKALIDFEQLGQSAEASVSKVGKVALNMGGLVTIPIELSFVKDPRSLGVISGLTCAVKISLMDTGDNLVIPSNALFRKGREAYVQKIVERGKEPERVPVQVGKTTEDKVEILSGIEEGDVLLLQIDHERLRSLMEQRGAGRGGIGSMMRGLPH